MQWAEPAGMLRIRGPARAGPASECHAYYPAAAERLPPKVVMNTERIAREIVLLAAAIAVAAMIAHAVSPSKFPDPGSQSFHAEKQWFYNRLLLAQLIVFPAGIVTYCLLRKLYGRWRRSVAASPEGPDSPPMQRTGPEVD